MNLFHAIAWVIFSSTALQAAPYQAPRLNDDALKKLVEASVAAKVKLNHHHHSGGKSGNEVGSVYSGGVLPELEAFYDVKAYDIDLKVDPATRSIGGSVKITFETHQTKNKMQLDLVDEMKISKIQMIQTPAHSTQVSEITDYTHIQSVILMNYPFEELGTYTVQVFYSGIPTEALQPPWEGGFTWSQTKEGTPWVGLSCEGEGAKIWIPVKDHPSDEPEQVTMRITVPQSLSVVGNGVFQKIETAEPGWMAYTWKTSYPINNYNINFTAGDFDLTQSYFEQDGKKFPVAFYGLKEDQIAKSNPDPRSLKQKKKDLVQQGIDYLKVLSKYFGSFPFPNEKMAYVETPFDGMEHQTAIAYGNGFNTFFGMDYIAYHELAHEWWGNKITAKDWADVWIHEGFATYAEALFFEEKFGKDTYSYYLRSLRPYIENKTPIVCAPNSTSECLSNADIYYKGANVLGVFRSVVGDEPFFKILKTFASVKSDQKTKEVTTEDFLQVIEKVTGVSYRWLFDVYLKKAQYPTLQVVTEGGQKTYSWNVDSDFPMPLKIFYTDSKNQTQTKILPMKGKREVLNVSDKRNIQISRDILYNLEQTDR